MNIMRQMFLFVSIIFLISNVAYTQPITISGDVEADFIHGQTRTITDPGGIDVGMPTGYPPGTISGHDMKDVRLLYDTSTDILYVGINTYGIAGDADGDGDPSGTSATLAAAGGTDMPDFGSTESFCIFFDIDQDGTYDVIAGVAGDTDITGFSVNEFDGSPALPSFAFGTPLPSNLGTLYANPSTSAPDLEFTILNFSTLPISATSDPDPNTISFNTFIGSLEDDGIGEDFLPGTIELKQYDFGDAPDPNYPTLLSNNGARHVLFNSLRLGSEVDADTDGQPVATCLGDDNDGNDDEDGVTFSSPLMQMYQNSVDVVASGNGYLTAWMDFNQDGDWADAGEKIIDDVAVVAGSQNITFVVPLIDQTGDQRTINVASRFRLCSSTGLSYTGEAPDGEVEDYIIDVLIPVELSNFEARYINGCVAISWTTATESANMGFYIYRSEQENGDYERINANLINGAGTTEHKSSYSHIDASAEPGKTYYYRLGDISYNGVQRMHNPVKVVMEVPSIYSLEQNYPNPFNPETQISFNIKEAGFASLNVYNLQGQLVTNLLNKHTQPGSYEIPWDGRNSQGMQMPSGTYLYVLKINEFKMIKKMALTK